MRIGVPREIKTLEGRIALVPAAAGQLVAQGHEVWVEQGAGVASGYSDEQYLATDVGGHARQKRLWGLGADVRI